MARLLETGNPCGIFKDSFFFFLAFQKLKKSERQHLMICSSALSSSHPVHVKEEPTEVVEEDSRSVSLLAGVTHSLPLPSDERDLEEDLPTEELE